MNHVSVSPTDGNGPTRLSAQAWILPLHFLRIEKAGIRGRSVSTKNTRTVTRE